MRIALGVYFVLALSAAAVAGNSLEPARMIAEKAISMGYGTECSLGLEPARPGRGYWPCADFGPYRYAKGYGEAWFAVTQEGHPPFVIAHGTDGDMEWVHDGPWLQDLYPRMSSWWTAVASGDAGRTREEASRSEAVQAAAEYIRSLGGGADAGGATATAGAEETGHGKAAAREVMSPDARAILQMAD